MHNQLDDETIISAKELLKTTGDYSVKALAEIFGVSRGYLYKHFSHLVIKTDTKETEIQIKEAIFRLRRRTDKKKLTQTEVALEAGLSRQTVSVKYKKLQAYFNGDLVLEMKNFHDQVCSEQRIKELIAEIEKIEQQHLVALEKTKNSAISTLMIQDLKTFVASETDVSLNQLQVQNDELKKQNIKLINDLAKTKTENNDFKLQRSVSGQSEIIAHFKADYNAIIDGISTKDVFKLFLSAEQRNLESAIETCITSKPDSVLFLQPFLSCNIQDVSVSIKTKRTVLIESNLFLSRHYQELNESLSNIAIHAVTASKMKLSNARKHCLEKFGKNKFSDDFLNKLLEKAQLPTLDDGFTSTTSFVVTKTIKMVASK